MNRIVFNDKKLQKVYDRMIDEMYAEDETLEYLKNKSNRSYLNMKLCNFTLDYVFKIMKRHDSRKKKLTKGHE